MESPRISGARAHAYVPDQHRLVLGVLDHRRESSLSNGVHVWREQADALALVVTNPLLAVDGQSLVGIDGDENRARVGLQGGRESAARYKLEESERDRSRQ